MSLNLFFRQVLVEGSEEEDDDDILYFD